MDCLFCKILSGEIPADLVYESDTAVGFRDINSKAPTHVLVIPRKHEVNLLPQSLCREVARLHASNGSRLRHMKVFGLFAKRDSWRCTQDFHRAGLVPCADLGTWALL